MFCMVSLMAVGRTKSLYNSLYRCLVAVGKERQEQTLKACHRVYCPWEQFGEHIGISSSTTSLSVISCWRGNTIFNLKFMSKYS